MTPDSVPIPTVGLIGRRVTFWHRPARRWVTGEVVGKRPADGKLRIGLGPLHGGGVLVLTYAELAEAADPDTRRALAGLERASSALAGLEGEGLRRLMVAVTR